MQRIVALALMACSLLLAGQVSAADKNPVVVIDTSLGKIEVELYADKAPITVKNFLSYVNDKFYDETLFHRVMNNFMIQGGGFDKEMVEKKTKGTIKNEAENGLKNEVGTIAMARLPEPHTAGAQFFINVADNAMLNHRDKSVEGYGYCVFGKVVAGMDVVNKIKEVPTGHATGTAQPNIQMPMDDVPKEQVVIKSIRVKE
jgi:cyclophilin family peptidyl-prolyl cis-trans isomerase